MEAAQREIKHLAILEMLGRKQQIYRRMQVMKKAYGSEAVMKELEKSGFYLILKEYL